jgi:hypothetical protein
MKRSLKMANSSECGPAKVHAYGEATENTEDKAIEKAGESARHRAGLLCHGNCEGGKKCNYFEEDSDLESVTPKKAPSGAAVFVAKVKTSGKCQCE